MQSKKKKRMERVIVISVFFSSLPAKNRDSQYAIQAIIATTKTPTYILIACQTQVLRVYERNTLQQHDPHHRDGGSALALLNAFVSHRHLMSRVKSTRRE